MTKQIFKVNETKTVRKYTCNSSCTVGCRIFHQKHDWVKALSENMFEKLDQISSTEQDRCEIRDKSLKTVSNFDTHMKIPHCGNLCANSLERSQDLKKHLLTAECDHQEKIDSDSCESNLSQSVSDANYEENADESIEYSEGSEESIKHLCKVCLLSFNTEQNLKHHMEKHIDKRRPSSILKKC